MKPNRQNQSFGLQPAGHAGRPSVIGSPIRQTRRDTVPHGQPKPFSLIEIPDDDASSQRSPNPIDRLLAELISNTGPTVHRQNQPAIPVPETRPPVFQQDYGNMEMAVARPSEPSSTGKLKRPRQTLGNNALERGCSPQLRDQFRRVETPMTVEQGSAMLDSDHSVDELDGPSTVQTLSTTTRASAKEKHTQAERRQYSEQNTGELHSPRNIFSSANDIPQTQFVSSGDMSLSAQRRLATITRKADKSKPISWPLRILRSGDGELTGPNLNLSYYDESRMFFASKKMRTLQDDKSNATTIDPSKISKIILSPVGSARIRITGAAVGGRRHEFDLAFVTIEDAGEFVKRLNRVVKDTLTVVEKNA